MKKTNITTKTQTTVGQKVLLILGVIGLIGFGMMAAVIANQATVVEHETPNYKTASFTAISLAEVEDKTKEAIMDIRPQTTPTDLNTYTQNMVNFVEEQDEGMITWPSFRCSGCGGGSGACLGDMLCGNASGSFNRWRATITYHF